MVLDNFTLFELNVGSPSESESADSADELSAEDDDAAGFSIGAALIAGTGVAMIAHRLRQNRVRAEFVVDDSASIPIE